MDGGLIQRGSLLNITVLGSAKHNILYYFCPLKFLSHEDMTRKSTSSLWTRGRGPQNPIRIGEGIKDKQLLYVIKAALDIFFNIHSIMLNVSIFFCFSPALF